MSVDARLPMFEAMPRPRSSPNYSVRILTCPVPNRNDLEVMNKSHQAVERRGRVAQSTVLPQSEENWDEWVALFATLALGDVPAARNCAPPTIRRSGTIEQAHEREQFGRARLQLAEESRPGHCNLLSKSCGVRQFGIARAGHDKDTLPLSALDSLLFEGKKQTRLLVTNAVRAMLRTWNSFGMWTLVSRHAVLNFHWRGTVSALQRLLTMSAPSMMASASSLDSRGLFCAWNFSTLSNHMGP